jgi:hypothetical protein
MNLTSNWDGTVDSFKWSVDGKKSILLRLLTEPNNYLKLTFLDLQKFAIKINYKW